MQPKHPLLKRGLDHLNKLPQIQAIADLKEPFTSDRLIADGTLTLQSPQSEVQYVFEIKANVNLGNLETVLSQLRLYQERLAPGQRILLVGDRFSKSVIEQLLEENIEFLDASGTIYLNSPYLYVLIQPEGGRSPQSTHLNTKDLKMTVSHLTLIYTLLKQPHLLTQDLTELRHLEGSRVSSKLRELADQGYLERQPGHTYRIHDYVNLLERWEIGYAETLRPHLLMDRFRPANNQTLSDVFDKAIDLVKSQSLFDETGKEVLIGGELGAAIATNYLQPATATFHIPEKVNDRILAIKLQLLPDPQGAITFLRQLSSQDAWNHPSHPPYLLDPLLIHAELSLHTDERLKETAQRIFDDYIADRAG